jgi:hypothetical protein
MSFVRRLGIFSKLNIFGVIITAYVLDFYSRTRTRTRTTQSAYFALITMFHS